MRGYRIEVYAITGAVEGVNRDLQHLQAEEQGVLDYIVSDYIVGTRFKTLKKW